PLYDALFDVKDKLHHVLVRHEQGAAHAAEGYARVSGKVGVCIATSGPGATNLVTGIANAMLDSVPIVCITGQVGSSLLGSDAFQETDIISITIPITKWNYQITEASEIPLILAKAFHVARSGRPGPVLIDVTKNAFLEKFLPAFVQYQEGNPKPINPHLDTEKIMLAAQLINDAKRPLMFIGHGVLIARAEHEALKLAEKAGLPVACTLLGVSAFPTRHPLYVGMLGMHGNLAPNTLTNKADVIIAVGMRFDDRVTGNLNSYAPNAQIIHIDIDAAEVGKNVNASIALIGDAKIVLKELFPLLEERKQTLWMHEFERLHAVENKEVIQKDCFPEDGPIKMGEVLRIVYEKTQGNAIIVTDVGQNQMMAARYYQYSNANSFLSSGGLGTMGYALPAAIGAKFAAPEKNVIAVVGDGGIQMTLQELGTIMQEGITIKILLLNNSFLGMVRQWQELFFDKRYSYVNLQNPNFAKICEGYGIAVQIIDKREQLDHALEEFLSSPGSYLLEVKVEEEANVFPMVPTGAAVDSIKLNAAA
ncbi:MAG: biosynthetic-type acetolactate synthase large subunit, partial [SAR324 cluster bacterium]|nr:biosynthetic-type acetolactate synthase large subunit [SAR324 cluster bacterium]